MSTVTLGTWLPATKIAAPGSNLEGMVMIQTDVEEHGRIERKARQGQELHPSRSSAPWPSFHSNV